MTIRCIKTDKIVLMVVKKKNLVTQFNDVNIYKNENFMIMIFLNDFIFFIFFFAKNINFDQRIPLYF